MKEKFPNMERFEMYMGVTGEIHPQWYEIEIQKCRKESQALWRKTIILYHGLLHGNIIITNNNKNISKSSAQKHLLTRRRSANRDTMMVFLKELTNFYHPTGFRPMIVHSKVGSGERNLHSSIERYPCVQRNYQHPNKQKTNLIIDLSCASSTRHRLFKEFVLWWGDLHH